MVERTITSPKAWCSVRAPVWAGRLAIVALAGIREKLKVQRCAGWPPGPGHYFYYRWSDVAWLHVLSAASIFNAGSYINGYDNRFRRGMFTAIILALVLCDSCARSSTGCRRMSVSKLTVRRPLRCPRVASCCRPFADAILFLPSLAAAAVPVPSASASSRGWWCHAAYRRGLLYQSRCSRRLAPVLPDGGQAGS